MPSILAKSTLERRTKSQLVEFMAARGVNYDGDLDDTQHSTLVEMALEAQDEWVAKVNAGDVDEDRIKLILHSDGTPQGSKPQFVGVNGRGYTVPRDMEVDVPAPVARVLRDAQFTFFEPTEEQGPDGNLIYHERTAGRFAMTILGPVTADASV